MNDDYLLRYMRHNSTGEITKVSKDVYVITTGTVGAGLTTSTQTLLPPGYSIKDTVVDVEVTPSKEDQKSKNYYLRKGKVINKPTGLLAKLIKKV